MDRGRQFNFVLSPSAVRPALFAAMAVLVLGACSGSELLGAESDRVADADMASGGDATGEGNLAFDDAVNPRATPEGQAAQSEDDADLVGVEVDPIVISAADLPGLPTPEELIPDVESSLPDVPVGEEILDTVDPVDAETEIAIDRDGRTRNSAGELVGLDQPASLACANVEISLTSLDEGDDEAAAAGITKASAYAEQSEMASVNEWSDALESALADGQVTDFAPLIGFLTACAKGGYEL